MKHYYPTYWSACNPIHEVCDWAKVRRLVRAVRAGEDIPAIIIDGSIGNGNLITGTHRAAANDLILMLAEKNGEANPKLIDWIALDDLDMGQFGDDDAQRLHEAIVDGDFRTIDEIVDSQE